MKKFLLIVLLFIVGCAPWTQVGGLYTSGSHNFSVDLPKGWMRFNTNEYLLVTRDGVLLQNILIERFNVDKELNHTKKKLKKGMLPQEAAEVILDNISSDQTNLSFEVTENIPVQINGLPGFKTVFTYKTKDGLRLKGIYYGLLADEWFYGIRYMAAARYYFDKDIRTFEKVFESFKLIKTA
jgi:hypothetical protein